MSITELVSQALRENHEGVHSNSVLVYKVWKRQNTNDIRRLYDPATIIRIKQRLIKSGLIPVRDKGD